MAGRITMDGLASKLDTTTIIDALVEASSRNLKTFQTQQKRFELQRSLFQQFNGLMKDLRTAGQGINELNEISLFMTTPLQLRAAAT